MIRFSFRNLAATNHLTPSSADPSWPALNARWPERPFQPWKTATDGAQSLVLGLDPADVLPLDIVAPIQANFTSATVQGNATNVWTSPTYSQAITLGRSTNGRYHHGHRPISTFNYPWLRLLIPSQTPVPEGQTNYCIGGAFDDFTTSALVSGAGPAGCWFVLTSAGLPGAIADWAPSSVPGTFKTGRTAARGTRAGTDTLLCHDVHLDYPPVSKWQNLKLTLSAWVLASVAATTGIGLSDGAAAYVVGSVHNGNSAFQRLTTTLTLGPTATAVRIVLQVVGTNTTSYFDDVRLTLSGYSLGGLWAGQFVSPPLDILFEPEESRPTYYDDVAPSHEGWAQRLTLARPTFRVTCRRLLAQTEAHLAAWREIDRQWDAADYALVCLRDAYPEETYIMRRTDVSKWVHSHIWSESEMELTEVAR